MPAIPESILAAIIRRVEAKERVSELAREYAVRLPTLYAALKRAGVRPRGPRGPRKGTPLSDSAARNARILATYDAGEHRTRVIAALTQTSHVTVRTVLRAHGRPPWRRPTKPPPPKKVRVRAVPPPKPPTLAQRLHAAILEHYGACPDQDSLAEAAAAPSTPPARADAGL